MNHLPAWSYSLLNDYLTCPRQYYEKRVLKLHPFQETEATKWGNEVHKALELRVSTGRPMPERMQAYEPLAIKLIDTPGEKFCEMRLAVNADFEPVEFFAKDVYSRGIADIVIKKGTTAFDGDYKTGKRKEGSTQLKLSAAQVMAKFPDVDRVVSAYIWLADGNKVSAETFYREDLGSIWRSFEPDLKLLAWSHEHNTWPEKPSGLCNGWCPCDTCTYWKPPKVKR